MISNRKRPRVLSTEGPSSVLNCDSTAVATGNGSSANNNTTATTTTTTTTNISETPPSLYQLQQQHQLLLNNHNGNMSSDTSTDSTNSSFPFYKPLLAAKAKIDATTFTNPFLSIHDDHHPHNAHSSSSYALEDDEDGLEDDDDDDEDGIEEIDAFDEDDDIIFLEQREIVKRNSDTLLYDSDALAAYNMFNVNNIVINTDYNRTKKQRTNSLPQLPQVKCFYNKLPNNYVLQTPKLGNIKTNVIPHHINLPPCDDENGHYIIKPNDLFANRFVIIKLLGQGTFGKVVQCFDKVKNEHVAIKIIRNIQKYRDAAKIELRILSTLKKFDHKNDNHCIHLRECFDYRGHICIVTDLLKISLYDFLENNKYIAFPGSQIQAIGKQLIRSIAYLHDISLIHTDMKPENILLVNDGFQKKQLKSRTITSSYLSLGNSSSSKKVPKLTKVLNNVEIQVIDFGSAIFADEYHSSIVSTRHYRAIEIVLGIGWSFPIDMWSLGCILVELLTADVLFKTHANLEHLAMIEKVCGEKIPPYMIQKAKERSTEVAEMFDDHTLRLKFPTLTTPPKFISSVEEMDRIDLYLSKKIGLEINLDYNLLVNFKKNEDTISLGDFTFYYFLFDLIKKLLVIDPDDRITADEALNHPWFNLGTVDEGTI
ncbi:Dual specificity protein kinase KNS1 [Candida viswanathii]|uniref:Dual specificity protein kinase KNS1 n=1 Tax=Candida viswanathii TaxID=5486 RepID=A0A367YC78_9ASCO|nr:Dual specificity protein kinase KNS1 [Candida viswanathii]